MFFSDLTRLFSQIINVFHCYILKQDSEARVYIIQNTILFEFRNYIRNFFSCASSPRFCGVKQSGFCGKRMVQKRYFMRGKQE